MEAKFTRPFSANSWYDALIKARSETVLRAWLNERWPAFAPSSLRQVAVLGAAEEGRRFVGCCHELGVQVLALCDDDPRKLGLKIEDLEVTPRDTLATLDADVPIVVASHRVLKAVQEYESKGHTNVAPLGLLQIADPDRFPPHPFYQGWLEDLVQNRERYQSLRERLADDFSRRVLDAVLDYRLTLDARILSGIVEWDLYAPAGLICYADDEVYVDAGAYDGDTIRLFIERVKGRFSRVVAFEPDSATFGRLRTRLGGDPRIQMIQAGLHRQRGVLRFDHAGTRGSTLVGEGGGPIDVVSLDEVLKGDRVTMVKMNIEGAELEALEGGRESIQRWCPRLVISAYHRPSDLWMIPQQIESLQADYRLHLRQHDGGVIETVVYALPGDGRLSGGR